MVREEFCFKLRTLILQCTFVSWFYFSIPYGLILFSNHYIGDNWGYMHFGMYFVLGFISDFYSCYYRLCIFENNMLKYKIQE